MLGMHLKQPRIHRVLGVHSLKLKKELKKSEKQEIQYISVKTN